jgi:hypothetical protein
MAAKEAEMRKTIDDQSGEIADLRKSNNRMKEEILARVSLGALERGEELTSRNHRLRTGQRISLLLRPPKMMPSWINSDVITIKRWSSWLAPTRRP